MLSIQYIIIKEKKMVCLLKYFVVGRETIGKNLILYIYDLSI